MPSFPPNTFTKTSYTNYNNKPEAQCTLILIGFLDPSFNRSNLYRCVLLLNIISFYVRGLEEVLFHSDARIITFADDSYVILESDNIEDLKTKSEECLKDHDSYLRSLGMWTNKSKTEAIIFNNRYIDLELRLDDQVITTGKTMKVLGLISSQNLNWTAHIEKVESF